jgi:DNA polymerase-3 subunit epsilon
MIAQSAYGARPRPLAPRLTPAERAAHDAFVASELKGVAVWLRFGEPG